MFHRPTTPPTDSNKCWWVTLTLVCRCVAARQSQGRSRTNSQSSLFVSSYHTGGAQCRRRYIFRFVLDILQIHGSFLCAFTLVASWAVVLLEARTVPVWCTRLSLVSRPFGLSKTFNKFSFFFFLVELNLYLLLWLSIDLCIGLNSRCQYLPRFTLYMTVAAISNRDHGAG